MMRVLSPTCGMRAQICRMDAKSRAFALVVIPDAALKGRNSATGSPRRSITMTLPSAASRTNSEVCICNSRTEVFLMCYIVAQEGQRFRSSAITAPESRITPFGCIERFPAVDDFFRIPREVLIENGFGTTGTRSFRKRPTE
jgi:hypothetical protein